jgi:hypothetical protein
MDAQSGSLNAGQDANRPPRPLWLALLTPLAGVVGGCAIYILVASLIYMMAAG